MEDFIANNIELISSHNLGGRPAFKLAMQEVAGRWYLYMGSLWHSGWSILDVTDPSSPELLAFIPGPQDTWTIQIQVAEGKMITNLERISPKGWGAVEGKSFSEGFLIWDVSDPKKPRQLGHYRTNGTGTHRNFYDGGPFVHVAGAAPGFARRIYHIVDISDPGKPRLISQFWLPDQEDAKAGATISIHGPAHVEGNRAYLPYGEAGGVIVDISDLERPKLVSQLIFKGITNQHGIHTYQPLPKRRLAVINDESINESGDEELNLTGIVDLKDETNPRLISVFPQPTPPAETGLRNFYEKGGRFGPHNQHHWNHQPCLENRDDLVYLTYFNAGLRVYDIRDERTPKEVAYFIPPDPKQRIGTKPVNRLVAQVDDVIVDGRGFIYISEENQGVFILRLKSIWPYVSS